MCHCAMPRISCPRATYGFVASWAEGTSDDGRLASGVFVGNINDSGALTTRKSVVRTKRKKSARRTSRARKAIASARQKLTPKLRMPMTNTPTAAHANVAVITACVPSEHALSVSAPLA